MEIPSEMSTFHRGPEDCKGHTASRPNYEAILKENIVVRDVVLDRS